MFIEDYMPYIAKRTYGRDERWQILSSKDAVCEMIKDAEKYGYKVTEYNLNFNNGHYLTFAVSSYAGLASIAFHFNRAKKVTPESVKRFMSELIKYTPATIDDKQIRLICSKKNAIKWEFYQQLKKRDEEFSISKEEQNLYTQLKKDTRKVVQGSLNAKSILDCLSDIEIQSPQLEKFVKRLRSKLNSAKKKNRQKEALSNLKQFVDNSPKKLKDFN